MRFSESHTQHLNDHTWNWNIHSHKGCVKMVNFLWLLPITLRCRFWMLWHKQPTCHSHYVFYFSPPLDAQIGFHSNVLELEVYCSRFLFRIAQTIRKSTQAFFYWKQVEQMEHEKRLKGCKVSRKFMLFLRDRIVCDYC